MAKKGNRKHVIMRSEETGHTYHTSKNKRNTPDRMEFKKYDPKLKRAVMYKEEK